MDDGLESLDASLPSTLGIYPGLCVTGRYVLSRNTQRHSGSGLKAFALPDGRVALAVADVGQHGPAATTATVRLMAVLRGHLETGADVAQALLAVERYAARSPSGAGATMAVALVSQGDGTAEVGTAGHFAPLVLTADGDVHEVSLAPSRPLGLRGGASVTKISLEVGDTLVMSTDGLLTARSGGVRDGCQQLRQVLEKLGRTERSGPAHGDHVAQHVLEAMQKPHGFVDDVALLVAQRCSPPAPFHFVAESEQGEPARAVAFFSSWLDSLGVGLLDHVALRGALSEITDNVVHHAYRNQVTGTFEVEASLTVEGVVQVRVRDSGRWHPQAGGGRRLVVAGGLVESLELHRDADGTEAVLCQTVGRPVPMLRSQEADPLTGTPLDHGPWVEPMTIDEEPGTLRVRGAVGAWEAEDLQETVHELTLSGTQSATVDLSGVSRLSGPAVRVLFDYYDRASSSGVDFAVVAREGTPADQVLTRADLPHLAL